MPTPEVIAVKPAAGTRARFTSAALAAAAMAADDGQRPGLWEQRVVKTVIDDG